VVYCQLAPEELGEKIMHRSLVLAATCAIISVQVASAADMPTKAPAYAPVAPMVYNWTGFYIGAHAGYGWGTLTSTATSASASFPDGFVFDDTHEKGPLGGGQLGYNYQIGQFVLGIEGELSWSGIDGDETSTNPANLRYAMTHTKLPWIADVAGRAGYAWNNWLLFAKGGAVWTHVDADSTTYSGAGAVLGTASGSENRSGWLIGGGAEWGFAAHWSAKLEYNYMDFGTTNVARNVLTGASAGTTNYRDQNLKLNVIKVGLNYRF